MSVDLFRKRNPHYNSNAVIYKCVVADNGRSIGHEPKPYKTILVKDLGFETILEISNGHTERRRTGVIETLDLADGEVKPNDVIQFSGKKYIVTQVKFEDEDKQNAFRDEASGTTTISLRSS